MQLNETFKAKQSFNINHNYSPQSSRSISFAWLNNKSNTYDQQKISDLSSTANLKHTSSPNAPFAALRWKQYKKDDVSSFFNSKYQLKQKITSNQLSVQELWKQSQVTHQNKQKFKKLILQNNLSPRSQNWNTLENLAEFQDIIKQTFDEKDDAQVDLNKISLDQIKQSSKETQNFSPMSQNLNNQQVRKTNLSILSPKWKNERNKRNLNEAIKKIKLDPIFNINFNSMQTTGKIPEAREASAMTYLNNKIYLFGGLTQSRKNDLKVLDLENYH